MSNLLSAEGTLTLSGSIAEKLGSAEAAIILQQIHYWLQKGCGKVIDNCRYIYNSYKQWLEQVPWLSQWKLRQVFYKLRERGLVKFIQPSDHGRDRTGYYSIDYEKLEKLTRRHVWSTTNASVENQQMQMRLSTNHIDSKITSEITSKNSPPISPSKEPHQEEEREGIKTFLGLRSNQISLVAFKAMMSHIERVINTLVDDSSAAVPVESKPNPPQYDTDDQAPLADANSLRRLSVITGLSVETLRTNIGLQKAIKQHPENLEGVLGYLEAECKTFKPGIGFVVVALREGRKRVNAGGTSWKDWFDEIQRRGLADHSMSHEGDIKVLFRSGATALYSQIKHIPWEELEKAYGNN